MAVLSRLLPYMNSIKENLQRLLTTLNEKIKSFVESVSDNMIDYRNQSALDLNTTNTNMLEELKCVKEELAGLQHNMTSGIAGLQSNMTLN